MNSCSAILRYLTTILGVTFVVLSGLSPGQTVSAQVSTAATPVFDSQDAWRDFMAQAPLPLKGCFTAAYPNITWQQVPCTTAPRLPYPPARGPRDTSTVGGGYDYSASVTGHISSAVGSFDSVTGVTKEKGEAGGNPPPTVANAFTLQLNTNFFSSAACNGHSGCQAWQQFVLSNVSGESAFMQYWLIGYGANCPANWNSYQGYGGDDCWTDGPAVIYVPTQPIKNLRNLSVTARAVSGGTDTLVLSTGNKLYLVSNDDSMVYLALGWQVAEFNIFGDCCGVEAYFNDGASIIVRTRVNDGSRQPPTCVNEGFTAETNNLTLFEKCEVSKTGEPPAIVFEESNADRVPMVSKPAATGEDQASQP
jgi:hypothetical protein